MLLWIVYPMMSRTVPPDRRTGQSRLLGSSSPPRPVNSPRVAAQVTGEAAVVVVVVRGMPATLPADTGALEVALLAIAKVLGVVEDAAEPAGEVLVSVADGGHEDAAE